MRAIFKTSSNKGSEPKPEIPVAKPVEQKPKIELADIDPPEDKIFIRDRANARRLKNAESWAGTSAAMCRKELASEKMLRPEYGKPCHDSVIGTDAEVSSVISQGLARPKAVKAFEKTTSISTPIDGFSTDLGVYLTDNNKFFLVDMALSPPPSILYALSDVTQVRVACDSSDPEKVTYLCAPVVPDERMRRAVSRALKKVTK